MIIYLPCKLGEEFMVKKFAGWENKKRTYCDERIRELSGFDAIELETRFLSIPIIHAGHEGDRKFVQYDPLGECSQEFEPRFKLNLDMKTERPLSDYGLRSKRSVKVSGLVFIDGEVLVDFVTIKDYHEHFRYPIEEEGLIYGPVDEPDPEPSVVRIKKERAPEDDGVEESEEELEPRKPLIVAIHDADKEQFWKKRKTFPNLALMKISAYHKAQGDAVEWWDPEKTYDRVYSSKVFDFTKENPLLPPGTIKGGTGYGEFSELPAAIDSMKPDYSIYPECDYAVGYLTRGCSNNCPWCYVPKKEGGMRADSMWRELVREDSNKLVLMDNNILACEYGLRQLADLSVNGKDILVDFNQGLAARLVTEEVADMLARINWLQYIRFSCDSKAQLPAIDRVVEMLSKRGIKSYRIFVYLLVRKDLSEADYRVQHLKRHKGIVIYAQAERNKPLGILPDRAQIEFAQRYIYGRLYKKETWEEYLLKRPYVMRRMQWQQAS